MSRIEKIKRLVLIGLGFALSFYLISGGVELLGADTNTTQTCGESSK